MPKPAELPLKETLRTSLSMTQMEEHRVSRTLWTNERTGAMDALDLTKGFSIEASVELRHAEGDYFILRAFARSGCTMCNRYWLRVRPNGVDYWYAGVWQELTEAHGSEGAERTYRMSVRDDTCVQIYEGARVVGIYPASYEIGFAPPTRGNWMEWERPVEPASKPVRISFDLHGAFRKG